MNLENFAENIRTYRLAAGLTQLELAERLFVTPQTVSKWETALSTPDLENLVNLAAALGVTVDNLLGDIASRMAIIAVDGGGTKTEFVLCRPDGHILARKILGASNPVSVGIQTTIDRLSEGIDALLRFNCHVIGITVNLAGSMVGDNCAAIKQGLSVRFSQIPINVGSDILNVVHSVRGIERCIAVICGTGMSVFAYDGENLRRFGGWGFLFDCAGSGYDIGREVLRACFAVDDGITEHCLLTRMVEEKLGTQAILRLDEFYHADKNFISSFAVYAFEAARQGDTLALDIIHDACGRIASLVTCAAETCNVGKTVIIAGGLTANSDILLPVLKKRLIGYEIMISDYPQIYGAVIYGMKLYTSFSPDEDFDKNFANDYKKYVKGTIANEIPNGSKKSNDDTY